MKYVGSDWIKASDTPVGYVYDWEAPSSDPSVKPVYIYSPTDDGGTPRYLPSFDSALSLDDAQWKAALTPTREEQAAPFTIDVDNSYRANLPDKMRRVANNIHWKAPSL
jgi:hypothetical protein